MQEHKGLTRRQLVAALSVVPFTGSRSFASKGDLKVAALDWAWAESILVLGGVPLAVAEALLYRERVVAPDLPDTVRDLGLRSWPNLELLRALQPGLIVAQAGYGIPASRLELIAPTLALPLYTAERQPLLNAESGLSAIAVAMDRTQRARDYLAEAQDRFAEVRGQLSTYDNRPLLLIKFADERLIDVYGPGSLFHDVLTRIGLSNGWEQTGSHWGFSTVGLEAIARYRDARVVIIEPGPPLALHNSALWQTLPMVRDRNVVSIPPTWVFGGLPSALRFAHNLVKALHPL